MKLKSILSLLLPLLLILVLPCCTGLTSGSFGKTVVTLSSIGLNIAAARGDLPPGTVVTIAKTYAILTQPGSVESKMVPLAELGLDEAVAQGKVKPGDELIIREGLAELKESFKPPVEAEALPETGTK